MYSRRPTSMPTWASADRTVHRGCEPKAINPLQGEKRERGRFLVAAILAQNGIFSIRTRSGVSEQDPLRKHYSFRKYEAGLAPSARQVPANPSAAVSNAARLTVDNSGAGRKIQSSFISRVTRK